ncbi:MAG TPA: NYN domain-containing protein [Planctomycetota bacterium]|nr:NYN domain-containing protein [Planctomycetota bacterium]
MFLIDGYNLLHAIAGGRPTAEARERMVARVEAWCRREGYRARIVFDPTAGLRALETRGAVEIRGVAEGRTADEEILRTLASTSDRTAYTVVSDDRAIATGARKRRFRVVSCREFLRRLEGPGSGEPPEPGGVPPGEVDYWMREFGLEE